MCRFCTAKNGPPVTTGRLSRQDAPAQRTIAAQLRIFRVRPVLTDMPVIPAYPAGILKARKRAPVTYVMPQPSATGPQPSVVAPDQQMLAGGLARRSSSGARGRRDAGKRRNRSCCMASHFGPESVDQRAGLPAARRRVLVVAGMPASAATSLVTWRYILSRNNFKETSSKLSRPKRKPLWLGRL